jgi:hypothetical protein
MKGDAPPLPFHSLQTLRWWMNRLRSSHQSGRPEGALEKKKSNGSANGRKTPEISLALDPSPSIQEHAVNGLNILFNGWDISFNGGMFCTLIPSGPRAGYIR